MSIKTDELQQLTSLLGTDSLLVDTASAGTGRLTMAQAAAFFGAELVKPENPVGAALSYKAALSVQQTVELTAVPSRTVEVEAAELASYIASLPRLLVENLTIEVKGGTVPGQLSVQRFYGSGSLKIKEKAGGTMSFTENVEIGFCDVPVYLEGLTIRNTSGWGSIVDAEAPHAELKNCVIDRVSRPNSNAFFLASRASACLIGCAFRNSGYGLNAQSGSIACVRNCTGSGNGVGCPR